MSEWMQISLKDVVLKANTGLDAIKRAPIVLHNTGIKCLRIQDISQSKRFEDWGFSEVTGSNYEKFRLRKNEIIMARTCSTGINYFVKNDLSAVFNNGLIRIRIDNYKCLPRFLYYIFMTHEFEGYIKGISGGTSVQLNMQIGDLLSYKFRLPPIKEQILIVNILTALDKKITLLRKQNETLEKIAQLLFKRWFIDFEFPNDDGNPYKSSGGEMVASELGEIPVGWRVGKLRDVANISIGRTPPRKEKEWFSTNPNDVKWISIKDMGNSGVYIFNTSEYLTQDAVEIFNIPVILKNTVIISFKLTIGRICITSENMLSNEAIAHLNFKKGNENLTEYLYLFLKQFNFSCLGSTSSIATAVNSQSIKQLELIIPNKVLIDKFNKTVTDFFKKLFVNTKQIQTLTKTRDLLLPKLMSGQIRIEEGEEME